MFQESGFLSAKGFNLHYIKAGNGPKALLSFHGFDRTGSDFMVFEKSLGNIYTIYAFDSLYHGKSYLQHDVAKSFMSKNDLCDLLQKFMVEKSYSRISLFGYSMGGRIALCILETMPGQIDDVFLMAPDGIKRDIWNTFATKSNIGKWLFKGVVKNPSLFLKLLKLLQSFRLIHPKAVHYIIGQMKEEENRLRLMKVWTMHKELIPEMERIPKIIFRYRVKIGRAHV